jgi:hypothetical protein
MDMPTNAQNQRLFAAVMAMRWIGLKGRGVKDKKEIPVNAARRK